MSRPQNDGTVDTLMLYAWLCREANGREGIICVPTDAGFLPLVFASESLARSHAPFAQASATLRRYPAKLVAFKRTDDSILTCEPGLS